MTANGRRVLVTGGSGLIGSVLRAGLPSAWDMMSLDRTRFGWRSMTRRWTVASRFEGCDTVIDLAAGIDDEWRVAYRNNIPATFNALMAARAAGVSRVVYASSNHVTGLYERDEPYASVLAGRYDNLSPEAIPRLGPDVAVRPDGPYALAKVLGEAAGRWASEVYGLSVICLRIGTVNHQDRPLEPRHFSTLLTHRDLVGLVQACVEAPEEVRFGVMYGVSNNRWRIWDLEPCRALVGYVPVDDAEDFR